MTTILRRKKDYFRGAPKNLGYTDHHLHHLAALHYYHHHPARRQPCSGVRRWRNVHIRLIKLST